MAPQEAAQPGASAAQLAARLKGGFAFDALRMSAFLQRQFARDALAPLLCGAEVLMCRLPATWRASRLPVRTLLTGTQSTRCKPIFETQAACFVMGRSCTHWLSGPFSGC